MIFGNVLFVGSNVVYQLSGEVPAWYGAGDFGFVLSRTLGASNLAVRPRGLPQRSSLLFVRNLDLFEGFENWLR